MSGVTILVALILSGARGPWLGILGAALPYYVLLALSPRFRRQLLFAGGVGVFLIVIILTVPLPFLKFQFNLLERLAASREVNVRFYYWLVALEMLRAHPWFGVGYGQYNVLFWNYVDLLQSRKGSEVYQYILAEQIRGVSPGYVHNDWLQFATETGVLGLAVWCALWGALLAQSWETARRAANKPRVHLMAATFLASFAVIGLDGLFNFPLHIPVSMFFFWLSLGVWIVFRAQVGQEHQFLVVREEPRTVEIEALRDVPRIGHAKPCVRLKRAKR
jgi:O-antigen ligase